MTIIFNALENYSKRNASSEKKKIGIFIGGTNYYSASSYIRLLSPLNELSNEYSIHIIDNNSHSQFYEDLKNNTHPLDIIIIQRDIFDRLKLDLKFITSLYTSLKQNNIKIIFDIDDDLLNIDKEHSAYERYSILQNIIEYMILNADLITVSTQTLKNNLINYNQNISIIPNTLMKQWHIKQPTNIKNLNSKRIIKIGYFGTRTHGDDIKLIEPALKNVKNYFSDKQLILEVIGVCDENYDWIKRIDIPNNYSKHPTFKNHIKNIMCNLLTKLNLNNTFLPYPIFVNWMQNEINWDIAVAPLKDSNINKSKSNLKYLEYTALSIPGVYSNIGPYKEVGIKNTGLVVKNNTKEWETALINLIENNEIYKNILNNAYNDVKNNYCLQNATCTWEKILREV